MGWSYSYDTTKAELIKERTDPRKFISEVKQVKLLKKAVVGNHLWTAWELLNTKTNKMTRYINLDLLSYNESCNGYGYKDMDESAGPFYYTCPLSFFKIVPDTEETANLEWREKVIQYHNRQKHLNKLVDGDIVYLENGFNEFLTIRKIKGRRGIIGYDTKNGLWRARKENVVSIRKTSGELIKL